MRNAQSIARYGRTVWHVTCGARTYVLKLYPDGQWHVTMRGSGHNVTPALQASVIEHVMTHPVDHYFPTSASLCAPVQLIAANAHRVTLATRHGLCTVTRQRGRTEADWPEIRDVQVGVLQHCPGLLPDFQDYPRVWETTEPRSRIVACTEGILLQSGHVIPMLHPGRALAILDRA